MNASKENCLKARSLLSEIALQAKLGQVEHDQLAFVYMFLDAAHKKLPREASYDNEKKVEDAARKGFEGET